MFAAVTLVLTGLLAQSLGVPPIDSLWSGGAPSYRARFTDVTGVLPGDDVRIAGVKVGRITAGTAGGQRDRRAAVHCGR